MSRARWCKAGLVANLDEAFERFLKKGRPAWVPKTKMSALEGVELIHQAGGLAVMAHPGLNRTDDIIPDLVDAGLDGIECFHTKHSTVMSERYLEIADKYHLLVTGGSDCHGFSKDKPRSSARSSCLTNTSNNFTPRKESADEKQRGGRRKLISTFCILNSSFKTWDYLPNSRPAWPRRTPSSRTKSSASSRARPS